MKLLRMHVQNYRGLKDVTVPLSPFVCITGENNSGKSTVLQALSLFLSGRALRASDYFDPGAEISIEVTFADITEGDLALLAEGHRERIADLVKGGQFSLVRRYGTDARSQLGYFGLAPREARFSPENITALLKGKKGSTLKSAVVDAFPELEKDAALMTSQEAVRQLIDQLAQALPESQKETRFLLLPTGLDKSVVPMLPECVYIPAVKDLADETKTAESSSFGKILAIVMKAIEPLLADEKDLFERLSRKLTRTLTPDGTVEDHRLEEVKAIEASLRAYVQQSFANVDLELEIPPPELKTVLSTARILADDGVRGPLELKGDGLRRAVVFSILRTYVDLARKMVGTSEGQPPSDRGYLLLFEEPELFLHPDAQKVLFDALGVFAAKNHVVVTTHSPLFLGPQSTATFVRLSKKTSPGVSKPFTQSSPVDLTDIAPKDEFQIICYENNSAALFAKRIVLVEGDSDYIAFPHIAESLQSEWNARARSVAFVRVGGKGSIARYRSFFRRFGVPVFVITDLDALMEGFDKLEPSEAARRLRSDLLQQVDAAGERVEVRSPKSELIKEEHGRRGIRDLWAAVRAARDEYDQDRSKFEKLDAAVQAFFAWESRNIRKECLRTGTAPGVGEAKAALIAELRNQGVFVLARGALEDYYPEGVAGADKIAKASAFRDVVRTRDQVLPLSGPIACARLGTDVTEHQCMCSVIFGDCELPCGGVTPEAATA